MLETLGNVRWHLLKHRLVEATSVPEAIRSLLSESAAVRRRARTSLYEMVCFHGGRYQSSPFVVPYLFELLESPLTQERHLLVELLVHLAVGEPNDYLPNGYHVEQVHLRCEAEWERMTDADREACLEGGYGPMTDLDCYHAVNDGVPRLLPLLEAGDPLLQRLCVYALAWFPDHAMVSIPAIRKVILRANEPVDLVTSLLALGLLVRNATDPVGEPRCELYLDHPTPIVRVAASIAVARKPLAPDILKRLLACVWSGAHHSPSESPTMPFMDGHLADYALAVLGSWGTAARQELVESLVQVMELPGTPTSVAMYVALVRLAVGDEIPWGYPRDAGSLDATALKAMRGITARERKHPTEWTAPHFSQLLKKHGLPTLRSTFLAYFNR